MTNRQDDFSSATKELLAKRVGMKCSNPNCRQPTSGPSTDPMKSINVGVAAHITAASEEGPRYDETLSSEERRSPDNGIWCCQTCGKLVDSDKDRFTVDLLRRWKAISEEAALLAIESPSKPTKSSSDRELIQFYAQCFDRAAFQDPFRQEACMPAFDKAIEHTITAINTGCLRDRDGTTLAQAKGKAYLENAQWRQEMDTIVDLLRAVRSRYDLGLKLGLIHSNGDQWYCINDGRTAEWMDQTREEILRVFGKVAEEAGVKVPQWTGSRRRPHLH